jgi:3-hydroxyacyl-[acyl-carrier-protein] dehydratase
MLSAPTLSFLWNQSMRFTLVDRITALEPGARIATVKALSIAEEYLADHFPLFPVMPGVLMLEAMTQAGAWLVRCTDDFSHSMVTLQQARNLRFRNFVAPGQVLVVSAEIVRHDDRETQVDVQGTVADSTAVSGRLVLVRSNLADTRPDLAPTDEYIKRSLRELLTVLYRPAPSDQTHQVHRNGAPTTAPTAKS